MRGSRLAVVALGGNALAPGGGGSYRGERRAIEAAVREIAGAFDATTRLLVVHGNGPQVGRLLAAPDVGDEAALDLHVAQTQGELGYLVAESLAVTRPERSAVALVTRVLVDPEDPAFRSPDKPVGRTQPSPLADAPCLRTPDGRGFRRVVASPRPLAIVEIDAIRELLERHDVVAGGGGGIPLDSPSRRPAAAVVDKDRVAALLAIAVEADALVFVTDVSGAFDRFGTPEARRIARLSAAEAEARLRSATFAAGSMGPKVESAIAFASGTGHSAWIGRLGELRATLRGETGTRLDAGDQRGA